MTFSQILRLLFSAAVWGASHVLVRITVPEIGPTLTAFGRMAIGALTLVVLLIPQFQKINWKGHWKFFILAGLLNTVIPLTLFSFASVNLPAAYLVIMNALNPLFSAIFSSLILGEAFGKRKWLSLGMGISGVALLSQFGSIAMVDWKVYASLLMCALAAASYGLGGVSIRKYGTGVLPVSITGTANGLGTLLLLPAAIFAFQNHGPFTFVAHSMFTVLFALSILGVLGTGIAFVVFYKLIPEIGPFRASLVTFLMPAFGILWGSIFLNEVITAGTLLGGVLVLAAAALFIKKQ